MNRKYYEHMDYVENLLKKSGCDKSVKFPFRSRSSHIKRVCHYIDILCEGRNDYNEDILYMAAVFHDAGYAFGHENHQVSSEKIFREYAAQCGMTTEFTEKTAYCIGVHSDKEMLKCPENMPIELILLMEADMLDEEGALAICWQCLAAGYDKVSSYEECLDRLEKRIHKKTGTNPLVTKTGRELWNDKITYAVDYIKRLRDELSILS